MEYRALREAYNLTDTQIKAIADDAPEDTSLNDLNLPTRKGLLDMLLEVVDEVEHQQIRKNLSSAIFETFVYQYEGLTEREQCSVLLECANAILTEYL